MRKIQFVKYTYCNYECKNSQLIILIYDTMNPYFSSFCESKCLKTSMTLSSLQEKYQWKYADANMQMGVSEYCLE